MTTITDHKEWIYARGPYDTRDAAESKDHIQEMLEAWRDVEFVVAQVSNDPRLKEEEGKWFIFVVPHHPIEGETDIQKSFRCLC